MKVLIVDDEVYAVNALINRVDWAGYGFDKPLSAHSMAQAQSVFLRSGIRAVCFNGFEHSGQLIPQKHGHDSRWRLVCPQSVVVSRRSDAHAQQALIIVDRLNDRHQEEQELGIFIRRLART